MAKFKLGVVPKIVLIVGVVGAAGYGINSYLESQPAAPTIYTQPTIVPNVQLPASPPRYAEQPPVEQPAPTPVPEQTQTAQSSPSNDRGLDALMQNSNRK